MVSVTKAFSVAGVMTQSVQSVKFLGNSDENKEAPLGKSEPTPTHLQYLCAADHADAQSQVNSNAYYIACDPNKPLAQCNGPTTTVPSSTYPGVPGTRGYVAPGGNSLGCFPATLLKQAGEHSVCGPDPDSAQKWALSGTYLVCEKDSQCETQPGGQAGWHCYKHVRSLIPHPKPTPDPKPTPATPAACYLSWTTAKVPGQIDEGSVTFLTKEEYDDAVNHGPKDPVTKNTDPDFDPLNGVADIGYFTEKCPDDLTDLKKVQNFMNKAWASKLLIKDTHNDNNSYTVRYCCSQESGGSSGDQTHNTNPAACTSARMEGALRYHASTFITLFKGEDATKSCPMNP